MFTTKWIETTDPQEEAFRRWIGDETETILVEDVGGSAMRNLPVLSVPLNIPPATGKKYALGVGVFFNGSPAYWQYTKSAPWAMQSILKNTDYPIYSEDIDLLFLIDPAIWSEVKPIFKACQCPQENIILTTIPAYPTEKLANGKKLAQIFAPELREYEQVIWFDADSFICCPPGTIPLNFFQEMLGGVPDLPRTCAGQWHLNHITPHIEDNRIRWRQFTPEEIQTAISEITGIPIEIAKAIHERRSDYYYYDNAGNSMRWSMKSYLQQHPDFLAWLYRSIRHPIFGRNDEILISLWGLKRQYENPDMDVHKIYNTGSGLVDALVQSGELTAVPPGEPRSFLRHVSSLESHQIDIDPETDTYFDIEP